MIREFTNVRGNSPIIELVNKLTVNTNYGDKDYPDSIMNYGQLCSCDDGFLCEHRLQFVVDFLKENFKDHE